MKLLLLCSLLFPYSMSYAWGKRGHEMVGSLAAQLLAKEYKGGEFLLYHSFDMGYYNNAPDLVWKSDSDTYKKEYNQHYMNMENFEKVKDLQWNKSRKQFLKSIQTLNPHSGVITGAFKSSMKNSKKSQKNFPEKLKIRKSNMIYRRSG